MMLSWNMNFLYCNFGGKRYATTLNTTLLQRLYRKYGKVKFRTEKL